MVIKLRYGSRTLDLNKFKTTVRNNLLKSSLGKLCPNMSNTFCHLKNCHLNGWFVQCFRYLPTFAHTKQAICASLVPKSVFEWYQFHVMDNLKMMLHLFLVVNRYQQAHKSLVPVHRSRRFLSLIF